MNAIANNVIMNNAIVRKATTVNFKLLAFLFAFSILLHTVTGMISPTYPVLGGFLILVEIVGWLWIVLIWTIVFIKGICKWVPIIWTTLWVYGRTHIHLKKTKEEVSVAQLERLRTNMDRLELALYGMTPEGEQARRTHFHMFGEDLPALVLPPANAALSTEFSRLTQFLNSYGFPDVGSLRSQDFAFAQNWGRDLENRLLQSQEHIRKQQLTATHSLSLAIQLFRFIGDTYPAAIQDAGYQRIHGALKLLEKMVCNNHCPGELVTCYIPNLQHDMSTLLDELKKAAI